MRKKLLYLVLVLIIAVSGPVTSCSPKMGGYKVKVTKPRNHLFKTYKRKRLKKWRRVKKVKFKTKSRIKPIKQPK